MGPTEVPSTQTQKDFLKSIEGLSEAQWKSTRSSRAFRIGPAPHQTRWLDLAISRFL